MQRTVALPTGTVTFLFTDIEGSTKLLQVLGAAYPDVLSQHHRLLRGAVENAGGLPIGTEGDSLFAVFDSPTAAVAAAVSAQRALAGATWPRGTTVRVRMGLHTGEGVVSDGTYVGIDVHRAARIAAVGHGGQILMSDSTRALVEQGLPAGVQLRDLGRHRLKDLAQPEHIYETVIEGLASEFPALRSLEAAPNNLPTQLTSFVGRRREVAEAKRLLGTTRLLTLTGPGGTGKTRLSLQLAAESTSDFADGVFFVPLGPIEDVDLVASAILMALGLQESPNEPPANRLFEYLRDRHLLLIMDNFEQLLPAAALIGDLLKASPGLSVVVTSRATLHLYGEREYAVPPLTLPHAGDDLDPASISQYEAVALFIQRAAAVRPDFQVTVANAPAVAEICSRLDGLPLAIELAAARVKLLPPQALLARLGQRLEALEAGSRDLPPRQRTLRGAIAWSHDLLDDAARRLFARFAIFVDGASLTAAEAVCSDAGLDVLSGLAGLVDQSLIRQEEADGEPRFTMLSTIREFALERLTETGQVDVMAARHAAFFVSMAEASAPGLTGPDQKRLLDELARENGNLRAAVSWSIESGSAETGLRLGFALWRFWQMRGMLREGGGVLERILAVPDPAGHPQQRARALEAAGGVAYWRAEMPAALGYYRAALEICRSLGDRRAVANALYNVGFPMLVNKLDVPRSRAAFEESLVMFRELGDQSMVARVLWGLGNAYYFAEENEAARDALLEDVAMLRTMSDPFSLAWALHTLGLAYNRLGEAATKSLPLWRESLEHFAAVDDSSGITILLGDFAVLATVQGDQLRAIRLIAVSDRLAHTGGAELATVVARVEELQPNLEALDPAAARAALAEGERMTVDEAVAYALGREEHP
ncbi:MAG: ATP-binding protein [Candidatus Limnocylindrales bacterium]